MDALVIDQLLNGWRLLHPARQRALVLRRAKIRKGKRRNQHSSHATSKVHVHVVRKSIKFAARHLKRRRHAPAQQTSRHFGRNPFLMQERSQVLLRNPLKTWNKKEWQTFQTEMKEKWSNQLTPAGRARWGRVAKDIRGAKLRQVHVPSVPPRPSAPGTPPLWGLMSSELPLSRAKLVQYMQQLVQASGCGKRAGLRRLAEASVVNAEAQLGARAPSRFTLRQGERVDNFDKDEAAKKRKQTMSCVCLHKGLCITAHSGILPRAKRLVLSIYRATAKDVVGRTLYAFPGVLAPMNVDGHSLVAWSAFRLGKPQVLRFIAVADSPQVHGRYPFLARLDQPLRHWTGWDVAREMLLNGNVDGCERSQWTLSSFRTRDVKLSTVEVLGVAASHVVTSEVVKKVKEGKEEKDKLDEAMNDCVDAPKPPPRKRRRIRGKAKEQDDSASSTHDVADSDDSEDSALSVHPLTPAQPSAASSSAQPSAAASSGRRPASSFFFDEAQLGVVGVEVSKSNRAACKVCSANIQKGAWRALYAWNVRKPHSFIHYDCVMRLDDAVIPHSLEVLERELANTDSPSQELRKLVRSLQKRVSAPA